jgi:hypothetical protein
MESMQTTARTLCSRCVLPEAPPHIFFDENGVCNVCVDHEANKKKPAVNAAPLLESDLHKLLSKYRGKGSYDCMVMCSGGKDSTSSLYYMKKRYGMNPLAFMFDNGFEMPDAIDNVKRATDKLGVDLLFFKSHFMKDMFAKIVEKDSPVVICHPCSIWYMDLAYKTAERYEIGLIVAGWTKGQSTDQNLMSKCGCNINAPEFKAMGEATRDFFSSYLSKEPKYQNFPKSMEEVLIRAKARGNTMVISPHWFLPFLQEDYVQVIQKEVGWKFPQLSYPGKSTNCALNFVSVETSMKHYGYTHYHVEMSKMIRIGAITREDALKDLEFRIKKDTLDAIKENLPIAK